MEYIPSYRDSLYSQDSLYHHGILGQKWGVRRYQNEDGSYTDAGKKRYLKSMHKDMEDHFKSQLSSNARKVTSLGVNGHDNRGQAWNDAYRKGKVTSKDSAQIKKAAKETRDWARKKYGESAFNALSKSNQIGKPIDDFEVKENIDFGKNKMSAKKKIAIGLGVAAGLGLAAYGLYNYGNMGSKPSTVTALARTTMPANNYEIPKAKKVKTKFRKARQARYQNPRYKQAKTKSIKINAIAEKVEAGRDALEGVWEFD